VVPNLRGAYTRFEAMAPAFNRRRADGAYLLWRRHVTSSRDYDDAQVRQAIAWVAAAFAAVAVLGYLLYPRLVIVWMVLIVFAVAAIPRIVVSKIRETRDRRSAGRPTGSTRPPTDEHIR
jgi:Flp pilus assembly protein TadB